MTTQTEPGLQIDQLLRHPLRTAHTDVRQRDRHHVRGGDPSAGLLLDPLGHVGRAIAKGGIPRKLGFAGGHELIAFGHVVDIVDGVASALQEEGDDQLRSRGLAQCGGQRIDLAGVVAAQRRVAAADHGEIDAGGIGCGAQVAPDLGVECCRLFAGQRA